jgi:hypothetical protein
MSTGKLDTGANRRCCSSSKKTTDDVDDVFEDVESAEVLEISVAGLVGETTPQTMRVMMYIK